MKYNFYYDETEHSRTINQKTIIAGNYYENFITVIVGWEAEHEAEIERRYKEFEDKYAERKSHGELKSTTLGQKFFRLGLASMNLDNMELISDFLDVFDDDIYLYFCVQSKLEYIVCQLCKEYENNTFFDADLFKYTLIKAIHTYKPSNVLDSIYNHPKDLVEQIKSFLLDRIEKNKMNLALKEGENIAFEQTLIILNNIHDLDSMKWDYHIPFDGFRLYLDEQKIDEYKLFIDKEGNEQNTLNAALDMGHIETVESDSKESFGIRIADFTAGIIAKMMKSLCESLSPKLDDLQKNILDNKWFDLNEKEHDVYKKLYHVLIDINNSWYKAYAGVFADDLITFIALLEYINYHTVEDMKQSLEMQGEWFNAYSLQCLERHFEYMHNK